MAFDQSTFAPVGPQSTDAPAVYTYDTPDSLLQVTSTGYFIDKAGQLELDDIINAVTGDGFVILGVTSDTSTAAVRVSDTSELLTVGDLPKSSFGELVVAEPFPRVQMVATHGLTSKATGFEILGGSAGTIDGEFTVSTGTNAGAVGLITSRRGITYKAGMGVQNRFTCRFATPVADSYQLVGLIGVGNQIGFGCFGTEFGIIRQYGGFAELQELTVTTAANSAETGTMTIDAVPYTFPLTNAGGDVNITAAEIAAGMDGQIPTVIFTANQDKVMVRHAINGPHDPHTFTSDGGAVGTFATIDDGTVANQTFVKQADWNIDNLNGYGLSGVSMGTDVGDDLNPFGGGFIAETQFQYLGYGNTVYMVADPRTVGKFHPVHVDKWLIDGNAGVNMTDPNYQLGILAASIGSTTDLTVRSASMALFNDGEYVLHEESHSISNTLTAIASGVEHHLFTVRCRTHLNGRSISAELLPIRLKYGTESTKTATIRIYKNATDWSAPLIYDYHDEFVSIAEESTTVATLNSVGTGDLIAEEVLLLSGTDVLEAEKFNTFLAQGETFSVTIEHTNAGSDATASLIWKEDI